MMSSVKRNFFISIVLFLPAALSTGACAEARVAILVEPDLVNFAGQPCLLAQNVKGMLEAGGIESVEINAAQMADHNLFNKDKFEVAVLTYGNTFPLVAYENLRKFQMQGGGLVLNGIPFCHPAEKVRGKWHDKGYARYFLHDGNGIGTGDFGNPAAGISEQRVVADNPLKIHHRILPKSNEQIQYLDISSFPAEDQIIAIVETRLADNKWAPAAAMIKHKCKEFNGASVLWCGQVGKNLEYQDNYYLTQVVVKGVAYMLKEKGEMQPSDYEKIVAKMDSLPEPTPLSEKITSVTTPRPWGDTFLPKSKKPAEHLLAVEVDTLDNDVKVALATLQGLTSRKEPKIWLNYEQEESTFWLEWHKQKGYIKSYEFIKDWKTLFKQFADSYKGGIIADDKLYRGSLIAANVAACEDLILVTPKLAEELQIEIKMDLRGKFTTYAEGMKWLWNTYKGQLNHHLCDAIHPDRLPNGAFSYDIQWKAIMFWVAGPVDSARAGADPLTEMAVMSEIFATMPPNTAVLGFPFAGEGVGLGEVGGTSFFGGYGKSLVCTDHLPNLSITSGVVIGDLKHPRQSPTPKLEKDKIYITLVYSDGDNENLWRAYFKRGFFDRKDYGSFPVSFGIGPAIYDIQPAVAQWYYEKAAPTTEFISDVSGIGYMRPEDYASKFSNREEVLNGFMQWTGRYMQKMDIKTVRTVAGDDEVLKPYIKALPFMHSIFPDMGMYSGFKGYKNLTYRLDGMKVFRCQTTWNRGAEGILLDVKDQVGNVRPAFVNVLAHCWSWGNLESVKKHFVDKMDDDMILVTPSQLAELYQGAIDKGWAK
ncbi:MAG: GxGYxYP family putative glycoside hydrolase [Planctomycetota bacterium]|nr:GxGYxYP family putative glycoside hydrolase [Planctomycetota bacterium]